MKSNEIKAERIRKGYSVSYMAKAMNICDSSYRFKENGKVKFSDEEKAIMANTLGFSFEQFNDLFFDGKLPYGQEESTIRA